MTLHEAIVQLLNEVGRPMSTKEIANALNLKNWYAKKDGSPITAFQIHGRTKNYSHLFYRDGSMVSLVGERKSTATYTFKQHLHNFATWTAARAAQRSFTSTANIKYAIERSSLPSFVEESDEIDSNGFEQFHRRCCNELITAFKAKDIIAKYGRAAKIIAIYLKTSVILPNRAVCNRSSVIHPPLDNILLNKMARLVSLKDLRSVKWTQLEENEYWNVVEYIKSNVEYFDWRLEVYWSPEID